MNHTWQYYQTPKFTIASKQFCLQNNPCNSKSKIASSRCNSSTLTLVPLLGTPFNTISCFSDHLAYLPNTPWHSRWIHQRGHLSPRFLSGTVHPGQIVSPISGPSIIPADNDSNWEDASTTNLITNLTANRPTSSTRSWSKLSSSQTVDLVSLYFIFHFLFLFILFS